MFGNLFSREAAEEKRIRIEAIRSDRRAAWKTVRSKFRVWALILVLALVAFIAWEMYRLLLTQRSVG